MAPPQEHGGVGEDRRLGLNLVRTVIPVTQVGIGNRGASVADRDVVTKNGVPVADSPQMTPQTGPDDSRRWHPGER